MELLAPAGTIENFHAALDGGADAVYVGAPGLNARHLARDLTLEELGAMIEEVHGRGKKIYIALNSLVREQDLVRLIEILAFFEAFPPDAFIVQDLALVNLVRDHFPSLDLHASTLMTIHNRLGPEFLSTLGFSRVVVARELSLKEIQRLVRSSDTEVEVFIHGAMCFSYSGLCLFSSYLGGKSGLRGNCVQPCRRKYRIAGSGGKHGKSSRGESGYFFSMNDLSGLEYVPVLKRIGVSSLKIEGRLRSATYVYHVVSAYRMMLDGGDDPDQRLLREAQKLIPEAMGRKTSSGYFLSPQPKEAIVARHSGNIGSYLGRVVGGEKKDGIDRVRVRLHEHCRVGDRLRIHLEKSGKRFSFRLQQLVANGIEVNQAVKGQTVLITLPHKESGIPLNGRVELFRVDVGLGEKENTQGLMLPVFTVSKNEKKAIAAKTERVRGFVFPHDRNRGQQKQGRKRTGGQRESAALWVRLESAKTILDRLPLRCDKYLLSLNRENKGLAGQLKRFLGRNIKSVVWALPPIIHERALTRMAKDISILSRTGFRSFQIAHLGQCALFADRQFLLYGDYTLNPMNNQSVSCLSRIGLRGVQMSIETDRKTLVQTVDNYRKSVSGQHEPAVPFKRTQIGMTVYGAPPLYISRISSGQLIYQKDIISPKDEHFVIEKKDGYSQTRPKKPFSLLPYRRELEQAGIDYLVVDLTGMKTGRKELADIAERIAGKGRYKLPTFNYLGTLE